MKKKNGIQEVYPDFIVKPSDDLMVKGKSFYAIWDPTINMWTTNEFAVVRLVDSELKDFADKMSGAVAEPIKVRYLNSLILMSN